MHDLRIVLLLLSLASFLGAQSPATPLSWIRVNQLGYLPSAVKVAVWVSKRPTVPEDFDLRDALTHAVVYASTRIQAFGAYAAFAQTARLDFSAWQKPGAYYLACGGVRSPVFRIDAQVYAGTADFLLRYLRQQRSGYNPFLRDSCHQQDGFIVYHPDPTRDSTRIDVAGGWHDASDYLQYATTSANATYQLLFAYQHYPQSFGDHCDAAGHPGPNGIPDVLDEAKWGLDWLLKMNPGPQEFYNQIADDRDHVGFRLPHRDSNRYAADQGLARPVYFITGQPQGSGRFQNRSTGVASTVGKFAAAFALGATQLQPYYPSWVATLTEKAQAALAFAQQHPGVCQTAPCRAPYFYEEDNYVDDVELAATALHAVRGDSTLLRLAREMGRQEPVTPWLGADTARHYQWYPFVNLGHVYLARQSSDSAEFRRYLRQGIERVAQRGVSNAFFFGVPFIWCSNNLVSSLLTQLRQYAEITGDHSYERMEAALRDWLFGCNPWGTSMICGLPEDGDWPVDPHSAFTRLGGYRIDGGLVDGPIYGTIWNKLIGIKLYAEDEYTDFQSDLVVYHDDFGDYSSNEPTMDGTASLTMYLAALEAAAPAFGATVTRQAGAITRFSAQDSVIYLAFTGHDYNDGAASVAQTLRRQGVKANFFLTGDFLRNPANQRFLQRLKRFGHYLGPHSDRHLLYCAWNKRDSLLVSRDSFVRDLAANYAALAEWGISKEEAPFLMPPFEWYNAQIATWAQSVGLQLINFTPGTGSQADYTTPDMANYVDSVTLRQRILRQADDRAGGLNGHILLLHLGTAPERSDKFYMQLDSLIQALKERGYRFGRLASPR